tara:strand:- start:256 stop:726 length:471 start_codon:yes stop_codon:yes gene_type:complete
MQKILQTPSVQVYLHEDIDQPNHSSEGMIKAALRDFVGGLPLSCKEPLPPIYWNKSDTSTYCAVAVGTVEVGVDIECRRKRPFERISKRYFHKDEITDDLEIFYDLWCQKEAYTKWKKGKIAENMREKITMPMTPLYELPRVSQDTSVTLDIVRKL